MSTVIRKYEPYNRFKGFLVENNIKQREVAELVGLSVSQLNQKLNGTRGDFSATEIRLICKAYDISPLDYFFYD
ncbi:helix-turn-helix domain-containing protein [Listeria booriae]|uniref:helix-turn-helix domain-containing protein n=1 Tax=Listeria booriae TaxID=1552123 RepID=UPI00162711A2|nr:helix-turn-helix transcriptional regulator [Listeria booriae]MBC1983041.1 helix-turn-helix transcriptional regulator [Listeria booriae]